MYKCRFAIFVLIISLLPTGEIDSDSISPVYYISNHDSKIPMGSYLKVYEDKSRNLHLGDMLRDDIVWKKVEKESPGFGYSESAFWFKLTLARNNGTNQSKTKSTNNSLNDNYLLEIGYPLLDEIEFYSPYSYEKATPTQGLPAYGYDKLLSGDKYPSSNPLYDSAYFVFPIDASEKEVTYYIRVVSTSSLNIPIYLWKESSLRKKDKKESVALALYYGIFLAIFLYNLLLFLMTREVILLLYCSAIFTYALVSLSLNGYGSFYLWEESDWLRQESPALFIPIGLIANLLYCYFFLFAKVNWSDWRWLIVFLSAAVTSVAGLSRLFLDYSSALRLAIYVGIIPTTLIIIALTYSEVFNRAKIAYFYALGFTGFLIGTFFLALRNLGELPPIFIFTWGQQIGSAIEMLVFSLGVGYKINQKRLAILREKNQAEIAHLNEKSLMLDSVSRFVPKQFIKILGKENVMSLNLGDSKEIKMTVLFSDIINFTTFSENMSSEDTFRFVNAYLKRMGPVILQQRGFIDKFIGDAIMALFAEDRRDEMIDSSSENAISAALAMRKELDDYNQFRAKSGFPSFDIGIGLNTGNLILGTVGSTGRLDTTVVGDTVNLCSRIESLTRVYGVNILIADSVLHGLSEEKGHNLREMDSVIVKGKTKPVVLYEVFDSDNPEKKEKKHSILSDFSMGLVYYKTGEFQDSLVAFQRCLNRFPDDIASQLYFRRCQKLLLNPPGKDWQGVVKLK